jgi:hypothetical protein
MPARAPSRNSSRPRVAFSDAASVYAPRSCTGPPRLAGPGGFALFHAINAITSGDSDRATLPPLWHLLALLAGTLFVVAALTVVPARLGGHRPATETLQPNLLEPRLSA